jgi:hypothetical protein
MISLSIYGYKKFKQSKEKKRLRQAAEVPPLIDQSAEFAQSPTSSLPSRPAEGGAINYAKSSSSLYSGTASEQGSAIEPNSAVTGGSWAYAPSSTLSSTSSEYQAYQQYVDNKSSSFSKDTPDQPPTYQVALSPPPEQARGQWVFIPSGGQVPFANGPPANPLSPSPLSPSPISASSPRANEIPASLPPASYGKSIPNELPAGVPVGIGRNTVPFPKAETPRFELAADETVSPSRDSRKSDSDDGSRASGGMRRYELA